MNITSAQFVKGITGPDETLEDGKPQIAFIGRSNVGKSSLINELAKQKGLAKTSSFPGRTQQVNLFLINKDFYFVDLPGYGFAKASRETQEQIQQLIYWYLFASDYVQKVVVLIVDANIGLTKNDWEMLNSLKDSQKKIVVAANKIDKLKKNELQKHIAEIQKQAGEHKVIPISVEKKQGIQELLKAIFA